MPKSLFRYRPFPRKSDNPKGFQQELDAISENYLWLSKYENLNDPMEFFINNTFGVNDTFQLLNLLTDISTYEIDSGISRTLKIAKQYAVCCFSKNQSNEALWAYYADSFRGICLEYDTDLVGDRSFGESDPLIPIRYVDTAPEFNFDVFSKYHSGSSKELMTAFLGTKKTTWRHEQEIRLIQNKSGKFHIAPNTLKSITVGPRTPKENIEAIKQAIRYRDVKLSMLSTDGYSAKIEQIFEGRRPVQKLQAMPDIVSISKGEALPVLGVKSAIEQVFADPDFDGFEDAFRKAYTSDFLVVAYKPKYPANNPTPEPYRRMYFQISIDYATRVFKLSFDTEQKI